MALNINVSTGIHYGIIAVDKFPKWNEYKEPQWSLECPFCGEETDAQVDSTCLGCKMIIHKEDLENIPPSGFCYIDDIYFLDQEWDNPDIYVCNSPYYTLCELNTRVHLNTGDLMRPGKHKTYCPGHEFFPEGAPYKIYQVKDGKEDIYEKD